MPFLEKTGVMKTGVDEEVASLAPNQLRRASQLAMQQGVPEVRARLCRDSRRILKPFAPHRLPAIAPDVALSIARTRKVWWFSYSVFLNSIYQRLAAEIEIAGRSRHPAQF